MSSHPYWVTARPRRPCSFLSEKKPRFAECSSTRRCSEEGRFHANFTYQAGSWNKPRRVIAKVAAERMCRACCRTRRPEHWIKEGKGARSSDAAVMHDVRGQRPCGSSFTSCWCGDRIETKTRPEG
jgi:hypothetical protein